MDKENENTAIMASDLEFLQEDLAKTKELFDMEELVKKIAIKKTSRQLSHEVKIYDPNCVYEVGDLIYKEYNEPLIVSSKGAEPFEGTVVLKVVSKIPYESFNCEMLEVDYTGGGTFRKHIDYMKKTQTQVLLPSNLEGQGKTPQVLKREEDPRLDELPMTEKDLKKLAKNLESALNKSDKFFTWNRLWQLTEKQVPITGKKIKEMEKYFRETKQSASTSELVKQLFGQDESSELFDLHCLSLNHVLDQKYKKNILFVSPEDKGKWLPKEILDSFLKNLPLSPRRAKLPKFEDGQEFKPSQSLKFPLKVYLTWREILSGGIKIPKGLTRELSGAREYVFTNAETEKEYTLYFYPSSGIFLGLKEFYEENIAPQGASLTIERTGERRFKFWLKKSKRKLTVLEVSYDPKEDKFVTDKTETSTHCLPHKIIHLEADTLLKLFDLYEQRDKMDLRELLILIFKNFGLEGEALSLHHLRALHLVDVLKHTSQEDVEKTLALSPEFTQSEKNAGIYLYAEKVKTAEDILPEEADTAPLEEERLEAQEVAGEDLPEIGTVGEIEAFVELQEVEEPEEAVDVEPEVTISAPPPPSKAAPVEELPSEKAEKGKKEKAPKKKRQRLKLEPERAPRRRKGEKKFIEERIELEESEMEALFAVKSDTKAKPKRAEPTPKKEAPAKEKKEEFKHVPSEEPLVGIFGDMLKSALEKKKAPAAPEEPEKKTKPAAKKPTQTTKKTPEKSTEKKKTEKTTEKKK
ncbi:MAG: hypothetical protein PVH84_11190 [Candidatus Aminicenantes bacterium]|jgi:hypothetical protein